MRHWKPFGSSACLTFALLLLPAAILAQTDEIQVYDGEIAEHGVVNLTMHANYTPIGHKIAEFPGGIIPNHSINGAAEWAYGVTDWFEQGLYLPVWTLYSQDRGGSIDGFKIRELFVRPHAAEHKFFYGVNFEFSVNSLYWEQKRISSEIRPIVGVHLHRVDLIYNPILDTDYTGGPRSLAFAPATRIAYNMNRKWAVAFEEYSDYGPLRAFNPTGEQFHQVWAVVDHPTRFFDIETGVGVGITGGSDHMAFKLILSRDLKSSPKR